MKTVLYSGSFDPVTFGHLDVIARGAKLFDRVVIAIGVHHAKKAMFSAEERREMIARSTNDIARATGCRIEIIFFDGLVVDAARAVKAAAILRGIRNASDLDYEVQMEGTNKALAPEIDVVYLAAAPSVRHIASSLVRQIAALGGPVDAFVPPHVAEMLKAASQR